MNKTWPDIHPTEDRLRISQLWHRLPPFPLETTGEPTVEVLHFSDINADLHIVYMTNVCVCACVSFMVLSH